MKKIVTLTSGGIDSLVMNAFLSQEGYEVFPLFIDWGQKSLKNELNATTKFLEKLPQEYENIQELKVGQFKMKIENPLVSSSNYHPTSSKSQNFVPARNLIFLSYALAYASSINTCTVRALRISIGVHKELPYVFPDSTPEFVDSFEETANKALYSKENPQRVQIQSPWLSLDFDKFDIVEWASLRDLPLDLTWSCYDDTLRHCGKCHACNERHKAFKVNKISDPTNYIQKF